MNSFEDFRKLRQTLRDAVLIEIDNFYFVRAGGRLLDIRGEAKYPVRESKKASQFSWSYGLDLVAEIRRNDKKNFMGGHF